MEVSQMDWIPTVAIVSSMATVVMVMYMVTKGRQRRVEMQVQMQTHLIDRFGSAPELVEFLHSPAGRQFVTGVQSAPAALTRDRIMSGFSRAIVLTMLGAGFGVLTFFFNNDFAVPAAILFFLGVGYLLATYVSFKLSERMLGPVAPPFSSTNDSTSL
jgi:hypothetical protein